MDDTSPITFPGEAALLKKARGEFAEFYARASEFEAAVMDAFIVVRACRFLGGAGRVDAVLGELGAAVLSAPAFHALEFNDRRVMEWTIRRL